MVVYQQGISIKTVKDASAGFEIAMYNFKTRFGLGGLNSGVHYQVSKQKEIKKNMPKAEFPGQILYSVKFHINSVSRTRFLVVAY